ncbi:hypothetical protein lbkm_3375 [Lachnospiraceae bacterium KM106-2]|nr:hypothetical protein lbkm_3375 [Lachnospiraceae bacterium KM106-2]
MTKNLGLVTLSIYMESGCEKKSMQGRHHRKPEKMRTGMR